MEWPEDIAAPWLLICDRDSKFTRAFGDVFVADGIQIIKTPIRRRMPTPTPSAGCGRSDRNAWIGCSSGAGATLREFSTSTCGTTTMSDRIEAWIFGRQR
jgi:hypothetical protein